MLAQGPGFTPACMISGLAVAQVAGVVGRGGLCEQAASLRLVVSASPFFGRARVT